MGITNLEKISLIDSMIDNLNIHINSISNDIEKNPNADVAGKPTRQSILEEFQLKKQALMLEKNTLTNQG